MTDNPKICSTCAYKSDGINTDTADYCYYFDITVSPGKTCSEWRGSLRDEKINEPEMRFVENVRILDMEGED